MSVYPGAYDAFTLAGTSLAGPPEHDDLHVELSTALAAVEHALGLNVPGPHANAAARLAAIETAVAGAQGTANTGVTNAATAQGAANAAQGTANTGVTNAAAAQTAANAAQGTANAAVGSAAAAQGTANAAVPRSGGHITGTLQLDSDLNARHVITNGEGRLMSYGGIAGANNAALLQCQSNNILRFNWTGTQLEMILDTASAGIKTFVIPHPTKPGRFLVHAVAEGPTADVFYRGRGQLVAGLAVVELPDYFEALTEAEGRTVIVQPIATVPDAGEGAHAANLAVTEPLDGKFTVALAPGLVVLDQAFYWRVDAIRKAATFDTEPPADPSRLHGDGPYTWLAPEGDN